MPGGDRRGPLGQGPMTGRGAGYCAGTDAPGFANLGPGRDFGFGRGGGRGFGGGCGFGRGRGYGKGGGRYWSHPAYGIYDDMPVGERDEIRDEIAALEGRIEALNKRMAGLADKEAV